LYLFLKGKFCFTSSWWQYYFTLSRRKTFPHHGKLLYKSRDDLKNSTFIKALFISSVFCL